MVVIVTGGGRGIGRAVCRRFAADGAQVVAVARTAKDLQETRDLIEKAGGLCRTWQADVTDRDELRGVIEQAAAQFGGIHVLVNCAGIAPRCKMQELNPPLFDNIMNVNVNAVFFGCHAVWPVMESQKQGVIVNISSVASIDPFPGFTAYGAAKAWVNAWTRGLAEEGRACGIRVYSVAPGAVETQMLRKAFPDYPKEQTLDPDDVAGVVYALTRDDCRHVTGQTVFVRNSN